MYRFCFCLASLMVLHAAPSKPPKPKRDPSESQKEFIIAYDFQKKSDWQSAIEHYNQAIKLQPEYIEALNNRGHCYKMMAKDYLNLAGKSYISALKLNPNFVEALEYQGVYFLMQGRLSDAFKNLQKLQVLDPSEAKELQAPFDKIILQAQNILESYKP